MKSGVLVVMIWMYVNPAWAQDDSQSDFSHVEVRIEPEEKKSNPMSLSQKRGKERRKAVCLDREPDVRDVVRATWQEAGLQRSDDLSRAGRVRISGWFPKIAGGVSRDLDNGRDYRYEPGSPRVDQLHLDKGFDWDVGLAWDTADIVYRSEELQVARETARRSRERLDMAHEVIRLYFARKKLIQTDPDFGEGDFFIRLEEITATLDTWTGGRYRRHWCRSKELMP